MAIRSKEATLVRLHDDFPVMRGAVLAAHSHYWTKYGEDAAIHTERTRCNLIRDHGLHELRKELEGRNGVKPINKNNLEAFNFYKEYIIKIHKGDENFRVALAHTQQLLDFNMNELAQDSLPNIGDETTCYLQWIPGDDPSEEPEIYLVCPHAWEIRLDDAGSGAGSAEVTPIAPTPDEPEPVTPNEKRVRVIKSPSKRGRKNE